MYRLAYNIPFRSIIILFIAFFNIWCSAKLLFGKKKILWKFSQVCLLIICLVVFLAVSLIGRANVPEQQWPQVFWSYRMAFLESSYDYFQEIYLNILSFLLISLFASELFQYKKGKIAVFFACVGLSILIENLQYYFSLGLAEVDDIISNILGSILGIMINVYGYKIYYAIVRVIKKWENKKL